MIIFPILSHISCLHKHSYNIQSQNFVKVSLQNDFGYCIHPTPYLINNILICAKVQINFIVSRNISMYDKFFIFFYLYNQIRGSTFHPHYYLSAWVDYTREGSYFSKPLTYMKLLLIF